MRKAIVMFMAMFACDGTSTSTFDGGDGVDASLVDAPVPSGTFTDFGDPIIVAGDGGVSAPSNSQNLFGGASAQTGGPCLAEPEINSLYPHNWLRPRFRWSASGGENLFELRVHAPNQTKDLLVYTTDTSWTMPKYMWDAIRTHSNDMPMTLTVRGGVWDGSALSNLAMGSSGPIGIAPVDAPGSIVYWYTNGYTGAIGLNGFTVGDESVVPALSTSQVTEAQVTCIGCHVGTPDGNSVVFSSWNGNWGNLLSDIDTGDGGTPGAVPSYTGNTGLQSLLEGPLGISTISPAHWKDGDRVVVAADGNGELQWVDVSMQSGTARGTIARTGTQAPGPLAGSPAFSHDGKNIVYTATNHAADGRLGGYIYDTKDNGSKADLYNVPYNDRAGGGITPIPGASDAVWQEYYPTFSPDDALLAFNRTGADQNMYNQPLAEVFVIPSGGGIATRLAANDPAACGGKSSPGVTNSWPKWAPSVNLASNGRTFYWLVFSSTRAGSMPQLYVTPVVVANGAVQTYAALYLWNQPAATGNHTPAWDFFKIPPPPPPN
jgi:hypothetical protein